MQILAISVLVLLFAVVASFAWYTFRAREAWSQERQVMEPYCLYLRDEQDKESAKLSVDNLTSGEIKEIPFCVSNAPNSDIVMGGGNFDQSPHLGFMLDTLFLLYQLLIKLYHETRITQQSIHFFLCKTA